MKTPNERETIRDVRDAAHATGAALDALAFIAREALPPAQVAALAGVECHLRAALAGLDALAAGLASERWQGQGSAPCDA